MSGGTRAAHQPLALVAAGAFGLALLPSMAFAASPGGNGAIGFTVGNELAARAKNVVEMNPDGTGRVQVTGLAGDVNDLAPVFSPDGNLMAVGRCAAAFGGCGTQIPVPILNADGTGERFLTTSYDGTATWSPDGARLAVLDTEPELGIYVINADGTDRHLLIKGSTGGTGSPTWSPDGTQIAFYDDSFPGQPQALGLYLVDVAGDVNDESRKHLLLADHDPNAGAGACSQLAGYEYDWSPDGSKLVYQCFEPDGLGGGNADIATVNAATGTSARIVSTPGTIATGSGIEWFPRWSPDGTKIVYEREAGIWTATAAGAEQHAIGAGGFRPSWQPCTSSTKRCGPPPAPPVTPAPPGGVPATPPTTTTTDLCPAADGPPSNGGCPINSFTVGRPRVTHTGTRISVKVPGPGTVSVAKTKRTQAARTHASKAGTVKLTLKLSKTGRRALGNRTSLTVPVKVAYKPDGGRAAITTSRIKFIR